MIKFINREQLHKQVWSEPFTKLGPKYNTTPTDLRKLCDRFLIPIPAQGHWQKIAFGKKIEITPLNAYKCITIKTKPRKIVYEKPLPIQIVTPKRIVIEKPKITVKESLTKPHPLIAKTRDILKLQKADDYGMIRAGKGAIEIRISPANSKRALRIMDAIFKWFEKEGYEVGVSDNWTNPTYILIDDQKIAISVEERSNYIGMVDVKRHGYTYHQRGYKPTNKISLNITSYCWYGSPRKRWSDGKINTLEELLPNFVEGVFTFAKIKKAGELRRELQDAHDEALRLQKKYNKKCDELEDEMLVQLDQQIINWNKSEQLRNYIVAVEEQAKLKYKEDYPVDLSEWLRWANKHVDSLDP